MKESNIEAKAYLLLEPMYFVQYGWNVEGNAPFPDEFALKNAYYAIVQLLKNEIPIVEVDADAVGGIAIWVDSGYDSIDNWIHCMNQNYYTGPGTTPENLPQDIWNRYFNEWLVERQNSIKTNIGDVGDKPEQ